MAGINSFTQYRDKGVVYEDEINKVSNKGEDIRRILIIRKNSMIREIVEYGEHDPIILSNHHRYEDDEKDDEEIDNDEEKDNF